jgi:predicted XRE-type DNA-binding protein
VSADPLAVWRTFPSKKDRSVTMTASSGNVFRALGFSPVEAEYLLVRADLMIEVQKTIAAMGLKQAEAAKTLRVPRSRSATSCADASTCSAPMR